jgi:hypothetical protein
LANEKEIYGERVSKPLQKLSSGARYLGEYLKDTNIIQGRGKIAWTNGDVYEGYWK